MRYKSTHLREFTTFVSHCALSPPLSGMASWLIDQDRGSHSSVTGPFLSNQSGLPAADCEPSAYNSPSQWPRGEQTEGHNLFVMTCGSIM